MDDMCMRLLNLAAHQETEDDGDLLNAAAHRIQELERSLSDLVLRCDGLAVMLNGSNIDTRSQHAVLGHFADEEDE